MTTRTNIKNWTCANAHTHMRAPGSMHTHTRLQLPHHRPTHTHANTLTHTHSEPQYTYAHMFIYAHTRTHIHPQSHAYTHTHTHAHTTHIKHPSTTPRSHSQRKCTRILLGTHQTRQAHTYTPYAHEHTRIRLPHVNTCLWTYTHPYTRRRQRPPPSTTRWGGMGGGDGVGKSLGIGGADDLIRGEGGTMKRRSWWLWLL